MPIPILFLLLPLQLPAPPDVEDAPPPSVMVEVLNNIRGQPVGPVTVAELGLPEPFLRHFAHRIILSSFEENFRMVIADEPETKDEPATKDEHVSKDALPAPTSTPPPSASNAPRPATSDAGRSASTSGMTTLQIALGVAGVLLLVWLVSLRRRAA